MAKISSKTRLYKDLVKEWQAKHKNKSLPKYFLGHVAVLGIFQRGCKKAVLADTTLKLVAPASKPPPESVRDVLSSKILRRVDKRVLGTLLFAAPLGSVAR